VETKLILDNKGARKGVLETGNNSILAIYGKKGNKIGCYHVAGDNTYDEIGKFYGKGDQRMALLGEQE
jgi:hypothetical protein